MGLRECFVASGADADASLGSWNAAWVVSGFGENVLMYFDVHGDLLFDVVCEGWLAVLVARRVELCGR